MTILVTGAAGTIGSEICRQLIQQNAKKIIGVDKSEIGIYNQQKKVNRKEISFEDYQSLHQNKSISPLSNHSARFSHTDESVNSKGYRRYKI